MANAQVLHLSVWTLCMIRPGTYWLRAPELGSSGQCTALGGRGSRCL